MLKQLSNGELLAYRHSLAQSDSTPQYWIEDCECELLARGICYVPGNVTVISSGVPQCDGWPQ